MKNDIQMLAYWSTVVVILIKLQLNYFDIAGTLWNTFERIKDISWKKREIDSDSSIWLFFFKEFLYLMWWQLQEPFWVWHKFCHIIKRFHFAWSTEWYNQFHFVYFENLLWYLPMFFTTNQPATPLDIY